MRKYGIFDFCLKVVFVLPPNLKIESKMHITVFNKVSVVPIVCLMQKLGIQSITNKTFDCSDSLLNVKTRNKWLLIRFLIVSIVRLMWKLGIHRMINKIFDCLDNLLNARIRDLNSSLNFYFSLATPLNAETLDFDILYANTFCLATPFIWESKILEEIF